MPGGSRWLLSGGRKYEIDQAKLGGKKGKEKKSEKGEESEKSKRTKASP